MFDMIAAAAGVVSAVISAIAGFWLRVRHGKADRQALRRIVLKPDTSVSEDTAQLELADRKMRKQFEKYLQQRLKYQSTAAKAARKANRVGPRLRLIGSLLPTGDEWRVEEMMEHRNELRADKGRVPLFHYVRLFLSALEIRWEARAYPQRSVD
ncbi:hypothetical protein [Streptomyces sp. LN325]|uniref:hypothetical protein n=1 Tax=Streptomyces sp. LN325 TaxID=3112976 RepID=UPI00371428B0